MTEQLKDGEALTEYVYAGVRAAGGTKRAYMWFEIGDDGRTHSSTTFSKNLVDTAAIGGVYRVLTLDNGKSIRTSGPMAPRYIREFNDAEEVTMWAIKDEASRQQLQIKSMNTKMANAHRTPLDEILEDIRKASTHLNTTERLALIAKLSEVVIKS